MTDPSLGGFWRRVWNKQRPVRYTLIGAWNTLFGYAVFVTCLSVVDYFGWHWLFATIPAQIIGTVNAYVGQRILVWKSQVSLRKSFFRFSLVYVALYFVHTPILVLMVTFLNLKPWFAAALQTGLTALIGYFAHGRFSFRTDPPAKGWHDPRVSKDT